MQIITNELIKWIKNYFTETHGKTAVIGISGGKDSTIAAALCVKALGKENVIGIMMPNGEQKDLADAEAVCNLLGIKSLKININNIFNNTCELCNIIKNENNLNQAKINLASRLRTTILYYIAQSVPGGRVCNTSNKCELFVGWGTHGGDILGDFSPLGNLTVSQICEIGQDLDLPLHLVMKTPSDGLTNKSDEDNLGVKYRDIENFINKNFDMMNQETFNNILNRHKLNKFKTDIINVPKFDFNKIVE